jgi:hypothetical protein
MSTHADPSKDKYLELEKKLGVAESELAADLADADEVLDAALARRKKKASSARSQLKEKAAARPRKQDWDGLQR